VNVTDIVTTEEAVLNEKYRGLRQARIEVWTDRDEQHFPYEVGHIRVWHDDELFDVVREAIEK